MFLKDFSLLNYVYVSESLHVNGGPRGAGVPTWVLRMNLEPQQLLEPSLQTPARFLFVFSPRQGLTV